MELKLNTKRTYIIGLGFFGILMLMQVYNTFAPLYLRSFLGENNEHLIGTIMALDNILALFIAPLVGIWSDNTKSKLGRRMPFIIIGSLICIFAFPFIAVFFILNSLAGVIIMMGVILCAMNIYRGPAVSLMPDFTPKPLRSKANAIINFVGYIGAILAGGLAMIFPFEDPNQNLTIWPFIITSVFLATILIILIIKVKENQINEKMIKQMEQGERQSETLEAIKDDTPLGKQDKVNLWLLIVAVFLWFMSFNAVETFGSSYAKEFLEDPARWGLMTIVLAFSSLLTFLPGIKIAQKLGRKYSIILGLILLITAFTAASFVTNFGPLLLIFIAVAGAGWAIVNISSFPMFIELASNKNVGKFTGFYYLASQLAQAVTPIVIGFLLNPFGFGAMFPYAAGLMILALVIFTFVKSKKIEVV